MFQMIPDVSFFDTREKKTEISDRLLFFDNFARFLKTHSRTDLNN